MKTLHLNLKKKWFDMILNGEKLEEYREIKSHWYGILVDRDNLRAIKKASLAFTVEMSKNEGLPTEFWESTQKSFKGVFKKFDTVTFSNGYAKNRPQMVVELSHIKIHQGLEEWGADKDKFYFVLSLGKIISSNI